MSDQASQSARRLAQRYGARSPRRRRLLIVAVTVAAALALAWLAWVMLVHGRPLAQSEQISFRVLDQNTAEATVTVVRRDRDVEASCLLRAQSTDHAIVGELSFRVGPPEPATTTLEMTMRTEREATSVSLVGCIADGQAQRR